MVFSSILFAAFFLPLFLIGYTLLPNRAAWKNTFILLASIGFYAWGAPRFIFVILFTTFLDFHLVRQMSMHPDGAVRKAWLIFSLVLNGGLLVWFKYMGFFTSNFNALLGSDLPVLRVALPIGISFFTFESITYAVDVYRRVHQPLQSFTRYQLYILFFPKLIAGPIVRYADIAAQLERHTDLESAALRVAGFQRFTIGLAKKVLLANVLGEMADEVYAIDPHRLGPWQNWSGTVAYALQIYFDFSAYTDMALGLGAIMGFRLPENFNNPYTATSVTDFWRRWHMTLGSWMRNYLYVPLGGNRVGKVRTMVNLLVVFLISGLWHGAAWGFVLWGAFHGAFLALERLISLERIPRLARQAYTMLIVLTGWVLFRSVDAGAGLERIAALFSAGPEVAEFIPIDGRQWTVLVASVVFVLSANLPAVLRAQRWILDPDPVTTTHLARACSAVLLYACCLFMLSGEVHDPFIYFRF